MWHNPALMISFLALMALYGAVGAQTVAPLNQPTPVQPTTSAAAVGMGPPGSNTVDTVVNRSIIAGVNTGSLDGSRDLKVNMLADAIPRLKQIQAEVIASAAAKSGNRSFGQDTEAAAAAGFVVRRGTQFFKDGKPFYFIGGNAYWFIDFYTLDWGREKIEEFMDTCMDLGISVLRTWFFNLGKPKEFDTYDARQIAGMEYVIWAAKQRGLYLTLTMGNLWNAYRGPEDFLLWATGSLEGKNILDFYSDPAARALYKLHIWGLLSRVNPLTGLAPKDDPTIFSYNIINEPRCPGCFTPAQQAAHQDWLRDIGAFMRDITPLHMISAGTEGFFVQDSVSLMHWYNPGPGAQCDGEDWFAISALPYLDYSTVHVYERHMELLPVPNEGNPNWPNWEFCDFECYVPWFRMYNQLHTYLAHNVLEKPVVIEEFGLMWFKKTPAQQRVLFQVAMDLVTASAETNGAMAGAMFWNAAHNDTVDWDGYNVRIDRPAYTQSGSALPLPAPGSLPATMVTPEVAKIMTPDNRTRPVPADVVFTTAGAPPALAAQMNVTRPPPRRPVAPVAPIDRAPLPGTLPGATANGTAATAATAATATTTPTTSTAPVAATTAPAAVIPASVASLATNPQPAVPEVPVTSATAPLVQQPAAAAPAAAAAAANAGAGSNATGRRLLGRLAVQASSALKETVHHIAQAVQAVQSVHTTSTAAAVPEGQYSQYSQYKQYSSEDEVMDVSEHLSGSQLYMAMFRGRGKTAAESAFSKAFQGGQGHQQSPFHTLGPHSSSSGGRQLLVLQDELDAFRRGPMRDQCAREVDSDWRPYKLLNLTDDITKTPRSQQLLQGGDVVAVISAATARLNEIRAAAPIRSPPPAAVPAAAAPAAAPVPPPSAAAAASGVPAGPAAESAPPQQQLG